MPWMETNVLDERLQFVADYESGQWSMTELCERYGDAPDRLQVAGASPGGRPSRVGRPKPCPASVSAPDERHHGGADRRGARGVRLGSQEAPADSPQSVPGAVVAGSKYRQRGP